MRFKGKICVVTGAASGLGKAITLQLLAENAVVMLADINMPLLQEVSRELGTQSKFKLQVVNVKDPQSVKKLLEDTVAAYGKIDYLFNNAGTAVMGEVRDLSLDHWRDVMEVNLFGVIHGIHYAYPIMIRQGHGHIVNTASGFGLVAIPLNSPYIASKFAVVGVSQALALEAQDLGVNVSVVCPGYIRTPLVQGISAVNYNGQEMLKRLTFKLMSPERAAEITLSGVSRKKKIIIFPFYVHLFVFLSRYFPGRMARLARRRLQSLRRFRITPT